MGRGREVSFNASKYFSAFVKISPCDKFKKIKTNKAVLTIVKGLNGDCSHEIKRHLLLGRKVMTNLDSILKSRDITLSTKVHLVKAVVFPVVWM